MGYPYNELITPAVLLDNPGLNKDQFISKLKSVHGTPFGERNHTDPWNIYSPDDDFREEELPRILGLEYSTKYKLFQMKRFDKNGLALFAPRLLPGFSEVNVDGVPRLKKEYKVVNHVRNELGNPEAIEITLSEYIEAGEQIDFENNFYENSRFLVKKVMSKKNCLVEEESQWDELPEYNYLLEVQKVNEIIELENFYSEKDLYEKWPQFKPENMYDFSKSKGTFVEPFLRGSYLWKQIDGKFYLDEETFNKIPANFSAYPHLAYGYTDLILTAEAIRCGAWKLLSRRGLDHLEDFLRDFPEARERYEEAIWDSHTSLAAKSRGMTYTELLRLRLFPSSIQEPSE